MSNLTDFTGGSNFPFPDPYPLDSTILEAYQYEKSFIGHLKNGDTYELPTSTSGTLSYWDNSHIVQWTKTVANFNTAASATLTQYVGLTKPDGDDTYVVMLDNVPAISVYYVFTVDNAGTITFVGSDAPTTGLTADADWNGAGNAVGVSRIYYIDSNTLHLHCLQNNEVSLVGIDLTSGVVVADPGVYHFLPITSEGLGVKLSTGNFGISGSPGKWLLRSRDTFRYFASDVQGDLPSSTGGGDIEWQGLKYLQNGISATYTTNANGRIFTPESLDNWFDEISTKFGITWEITP